MSRRNIVGGITLFSTNESPHFLVKNVNCLPRLGSFKTAGKFCDDEKTDHCSSGPFVI